MENTNQDKTHPTDKEIISYLVDKDYKKKYSEKLAAEYQVDRSHKKPVKLSYFTYMKYAAIFVLLLGAIGVLRHYTNNTLENLTLAQIQSSNVLGDQSLMRKDNSANESLRIDANTAFVNSHYQQAVTNYETLKTQTTLTDTDLFYLGVSYLKIEKPEPKKAIAAFLQLKDGHSFDEEVHWFLGLAYILDHNIPLAKKMMSEIVAKKSFQYKNATILLNKMADIS